MKYIFTTLIVLILVSSAIISYGQNSSSDKSQFTSEGVRLYLLGKKSDVVPAPNAQLRVINDVLIMRLGYYAPRNFIPPTIYLELTSFSAKSPKYKDNSMLTIFIDDKPIMTENMELQGSIFGIAEKFYNSDIKFNDFLKFTAGKKVKIQFGNTIIELKDEEIKALNDLNETTNHLVYPPIFAPI